MKMELELRSAQSITPQMIHSMTILQYGTQELAEYLSDLSYENPLLDLQEPRTDEKSAPTLDRLRWLQSSDRQNRSYYADEDQRRCFSGSRETQHTLEAFLREQLLSMSVPEDIRQAVFVLIELLDEHGFFTGSINEVCRLSRCKAATAQKALSLLRTLEPAGVGAGTVQESLLLQLARLEEDTELPRRIIAEQYRLISSPARLAAALKVSPKQVEAALSRLAALTPYPADGFDTPDAILYVRPDLYIYAENDSLTVRCGEDILPQVHINSQYLNMLETERDPAVQKYLREKLRQVEQVMHDLNNRKSTMLRCGEILAEQQKDFFSGGSLKKLTLRDVAQELEVHESTVSRTVKDKYVQCSRGLFPMSHFFSRSAGQNPTLCRGNIQDALAKLIDGEDPARPYSDEKLSRLLAAQHIVISRRTVAKYRMELGILSASARKRPEL